MLYPQVNATRMVTSLDGFWQFQVADQKAIDLHQPLPAPLTMAVPASFNDQVVDQTLRNHDGYFWYETTFNISKLQKTQRNVLRFGSVTHSAVVYINGHEAGRHQGGFTPFEIELDDYIQVGKNDLKVQVSNLLDNTTLPSGELTQQAGQYHVTPRFDFYNYAGINRPVKIFTTNKQVHIDDVVVKYHTDLHQTNVLPDIKITGNYHHLTLQIIDEANNVVVQNNSASTTTIKPLLLADTHLWQPRHAYLYKLAVMIYDANDELLDTYEQTFGIRTVKIAHNQILVNDQPIYLKGFGRHEDFPVIGKGMNQAVINHDHNLMKWLNANAFRTSHYPYSEEEMQLADRDGLLVIDETPAVGLFVGFSASMAMGQGQVNTWQTLKTQAAHQQVIREMITRDQNHPAVLMWSIANEPASQQVGAHEYFAPLVQLTKQLDWQKLPVMAPKIMVATPDVDRIADLFDVIALNRYYGWYADFNDLTKAKQDLQNEIKAWHQKYPDKPIIFTEFGADTLSGMHSLAREPYSEEYQLDYYQMNLAVFDEFDYVVGELLWNFTDFATPTGLIRINGNRKGIFTRDRQPKDIAYLLKKRWAHK